MPSVWDTPPTEAEIKASVWNTPPTPEEMGRPAMLPSHGKNVATTAVPTSESAVLGATQGGTAGWGDEIAAGVSAALPSFLRMEEDRKAVGEGETIGDRYRLARDYYRRKNESAQKANPGTYLGGQVAGTVLAARGLPLRGTAGVLSSAGLGSVEGAGYSENEGLGLARDTTVGAGAGLVGHAAGSLVGKAAQGASNLLRRGLGRIRGREVGKGLEEATQEAASLAGKYGGLRQTENKAIREAAAMEAAGTLSPENARLLAEARASGRFNEALNEALANDLEFLTKRTGEVQAAKEAARSAREAIPAKAEQLADEALSSEAAKRAVMDRVKRYWLPITAGAVGYAVDGPAGAGIGALAGRGASPTVHALRRMVKNPAVQTRVLKALDRAASAPNTVAGEEIRRVFLQRALPAAIASAQTPDEEAQIRALAEALAAPAR